MDQKSFTEEAISTLFGNVAGILALHQRLVEDLERCLPNGPVHDARVSQCFLKYVSDSLPADNSSAGQELAVIMRIT